MDLTTAKNIVVIGGGQAAAQALASLRMWGYGGGLDLVCAESDLPYQRPPLSKAYLKGDLPRERLYFKPDAWYADNNITLHLGVTADQIERRERIVRLSDGTNLPYDVAIIATGSRPRRLPCPGADLANVFELRGLADVDQLSPQMAVGRRMVIVGAGYIGLEAAAVAKQMGLEVTVLEMAPRVLARVTSPIMSDFYTREHTSQGVDIRCDTALTELIGANGNVTAARLADGTDIPADIVLVGIGILPNESLASDAGLACSNGIRVDRDARTNDPRIFAAGDCARRPLVHYGRESRLESVHNAIEQGKLAAASICGRPRPPEDTPWFWSDQYDLKLQIAGLSEGYDDLVVRGDPNDRKFAVFYLRTGHLIAVDAINSAPEFLASKRMIANGAKISPKVLSDTSISMKEIAAQAA